MSSPASPKIPTWNPGQYLKFAGQRMRPAIDLLNQVAVEAPDVVYDLGCGPGNVTPYLKGRWPAARLVGIDSSAEMLEKARASDPSVDWVQADGATWKPAAPAEVIYSNAALQWIDRHDRLFPHLMGCLAKGGVLAVQMPRNHAAMSHRGIVETVMEGAWRDRLEPVMREFPVHEPDAYYDILAPHASDLNIWESVYAQVMEGDNPVAEWTKGSALKPFLDALTDPAENALFWNTYSKKMQAAYPKRADGRTLFHFRRLFIVATR